MKFMVVFSAVFILISSLYPEGEAISSFEWSDSLWNIKRSSLPMGPGPNYFSAISLGKGDPIEPLELNIKSNGKKWFASEIYTEKKYSYGTFSIDFELPGKLDSNAVFGFFLYNCEIPPYFNEIDFEIARWGIPEGFDGHTSIQPYTREGNSRSFFIGDLCRSCRAEIIWLSDLVIITLYSSEGEIIDNMEYSGPDIPKETKSSVHLNLWLFEGKEPAGDGGLSVRIHSFFYTPYQ